MEDVVQFAGPVDVGGDVVVDELEVRAGAQVRDVVEVAGDQVVHGHHAVAFGEQPVAKMGAEEAGAAGDERDGLTGSGVHGGAGCHVTRI